MNDSIGAEAIRKVLREITDPEVGINIVDLGLIYDVLLSEKGDYLIVRMTMTSPACPMASHISDEVQDALRRRWPSLKQVEVELVWEPPWDTERMSAAAKRQLGWDDA
ncbi:MAG TPA: metal-sulfur cluster assembly factor [Gammaproteobacteria bacterium]